MNIGDGVTVTFAAGTYVIGDKWEFSASYYFLRDAMDSGANDTTAPIGDDNPTESFCRDCHRSWVMKHTDIRAYDGTYKSHPVGVALQENTGGAQGLATYDRATPLDGNGGTDSNDSNDLKLFDSGGTDYVQCLTCHGVHNVDSNTKSDDSR